MITQVDQEQKYKIASPSSEYETWSEFSSRLSSLKMRPTSNSATINYERKEMMEISSRTDFKQFDYQYLLIVIIEWQIVNE